MNRRQFINRGAALLAAGSIAGRHAFAAVAAKPNKSRIGIQLYSVKDELPKDFEGTLKKLSVIGYSSVEPYGFNGDKFLGHTMKELSDMVKDMGMTVSGTHTGSGILPEDTGAKEWDFWKKVAPQVKAGGGKWAIQAGFPGAKTVDDLKRIAEHFNRVGEVCQKGGVKFAFHNHHADFGKIDDEVILDFLIKKTDPKLVSFQLDMGHTVNGGGDCLHYLRNFPGRIRLWHASDFDKASRTYTETGKGSVPYPEMFKLAKSSGLEQLTVEQETPGDIFASCKVDFDYLKQFKW
jgi:sugar phosphate isomerase/epimerase